MDIAFELRCRGRGPPAPDALGTTGGPAADIAWASGLVERNGPAVQHRTWNLSAIWSMPTAQGTAWLKCVPGFFGQEGAVLGLLAGQGVPQLIATVGHRILLRDMGGARRLSRHC